MKMMFEGGHGEGEEVKKVIRLENGQLRGSNASREEEGDDVGTRGRPADPGKGMEYSREQWYEVTIEVSCS